MELGPYASILREQVDRRTLHRGRLYYEQGRVRKLRITSDDQLVAVVDGTRPYLVSLGLDEEGLEGDCDCPAWEWQGICKHLVALAFQADADEFSHRVLRRFLADPAESGGALSSGELEDHPRGAAGPMSDLPAAHWRTRLRALEQGSRRRREQPAPSAGARPALFEVWVDPDDCRAQSGLVLVLTRRRRLKSGAFGEASEANWSRLDAYRTMPHAVRLALGRVESYGRSERYSWEWRHRGAAELLVPAADAVHVFALLDGVVPVHVRTTTGEWGPPLAWSDDPWRFHLTLELSEREGVAAARVDGQVRRGDEVRSLTDPVLLLASGIVLFDDAGAPLDDADAFDWILGLRHGGPLEVRGDEVEPFLEKLLEVALGVPLDVGAQAEVAEAPAGVLDLVLSDSRHVDVGARLEYGRARVPLEAPQRHLLAHGTPPRVLVRNEEAEAVLQEALWQEGLERHGPEWVASPYRMPAQDLPARCRRLMEAGWQVRVENKALRAGGTLSLSVSSGIDWFDVKGEATFDESALPLPEILRAVQEGRGFVTLEDGGAALLPPDWTARLEALGALSGAPGSSDRVQVDRARAPLLDVLLAGFADVAADATFERLRKTLRTFGGIRPKREVKAFRGELRAYQREALGWFHFLRKAGLGGCLADDMGLGKTVQVLACLLSRRRARDRTGPSLVVAPRSVMSNWVREAARFAPGLRTATYHGPERAAVLEDVSGLDVIVTTYGTLLRDIGALGEIPFDYAILDEAQAIKNAASKTARAARLLDARHRLALSGTPIENHLDELGSLFAFLNPGLLGSKREFQALLGGTGTPSAERLAWLQAALRPVILRRTREQVLTELPEKEEHVLVCPLSAKQRRDYEGIREHYRASVLSRIDSRGLARSKMHVLEALLRLRQAACHPGLIDPARRAEPAAKLDQLLPMLTELSDAGHKALVFSQFTSLLSIVRERLEDAGIRYEYMDGRTRKRGERIDRFQADPDTTAFLISLKAGGTGLNLTAAQYVFLLDPWWNPAVEAQAVGRAHRMGQERHVTVYRLIGEDTVEDRVLELQARKRELVQAVLGGVSDAPLRGITRDDLELLLG